MKKFLLTGCATLLLASPALASIQTLDFRGFTLSFDNEYISAVGQEEAGNDGLGYFNFNWQAIAAEAGQEHTAAFSPKFEIKAKVDSYLISYRGEVGTQTRSRNGGLVEFTQQVAADLHGGFASDAQISESTLLSSETSSFGTTEVWRHSYEQFYFGETTALTLNGLANVRLAALNADSFADFAFSNHVDAYPNPYQFSLSIGSVQPVPEPEMMTLFGLGGLLVLLRRRHVG